MTLRIARSNGTVLAALAVGTRVFIGLSTDLETFQNTAWLSALLGAAFCLPLLLIAPGVASKPSSPQISRTRRAWMLLLACLFIADASRMALLLADAVDYATMTSIRPIFLLVPSLLALFVSLLANGEGISGAARLWFRTLPLFILIVICQHGRSYNFSWLFPILGPGIAQILDGALAAAGWFSLAITYSAVSSPEPDHRHDPRRLTLAVCIAAVCASALLALHAAMLPAQASGAATRVFQLDALISNGRATIATQLPMTAILFAGLLILLLFESFVSAKLLQLVLPRLDGRLCLSISCAAVLFLSLSGMSEHPYAIWAGRRLFLLGNIPALCRAKPERSVAH